MTEAITEALSPGKASPLLQMERITKAFPGQVAVNDVSLALTRGEIHALVGENGAGKTTLIKVLAGEYPPDAGRILLDGVEVTVRHPWEATRLGIGFIHQEPALVPTLPVRENLTLGFGHERNRFGLVSWRRQDELARAALARVRLGVDLEAPLGDLSVHEQQLVAVARVLLRSARIVVFDEVTAPLSETEVATLFELVRELRESGVAVLYVSHRLEEIFNLADRVTVLKNGRTEATEEVATLTPRSLARLIIGKDPSGRFEEPVPPGREPMLSVRGLRDDLLDNVTFDLHEGEVLGLAGLAGAGRTNVLETIFGARVPTAGTILLDGEPLALRHPADAVRHGIAMVTEDRKRTGYVAALPVWQNITLPWVRAFTKAGLLQLRRERLAAEKAARRFDVRTPSVEAPIRELSGGNQQKALLARWLSRQVRVLLLDQPTHGVDIGAKEEIYGVIRAAAAAGTAVILVSDELEELEGLCARVLLLSGGRIISELSGGDIEKPKMLAALLGQHAPKEGG